MTSTIKIGTPVCWVQTIHNGHVIVDELNRRQPPRKEIRTGRIGVSGPDRPLDDTTLTLISEEEWDKLTFGGEDYEEIAEKYLEKKKGGRKTRTNRRRRNNRTKGRSKQ